MARQKTKLVKGCKVRLKRDFHTRGGLIVRTGVVMVVDYFETRDVHLSCWVRARRKSIRLEKKSVDSYLELVWAPEETEEEQEDVHHDH